MEKTKYTPGPWEVSSSYKREVKANNELLAVAAAPASYDGDVLAEANAKLIAAAPELLESLKKTEDFITRCLTLEGRLSKEEIYIIVGHAREAIKKATT